MNTLGIVLQLSALAAVCCDKPILANYVKIPKDFDEFEIDAIEAFKNLSGACPPIYQQWKKLDNKFSVAWAEMVRDLHQTSRPIEVGSLREFLAVDLSLNDFDAIQGI